MTNSLQQQIEELKEANRKLLAENIDIKIENERLKARIQSLECVKKLLEEGGIK